MQAVDAGAPASDVDGHNFPNLCLMKLSACHKARGDTVEWYDGGKWYDLVYMSRVFTDTYSKDYEGSIKACHVIKGGTGYGLDNKLPDIIENNKSMEKDHGWLIPTFQKCKLYRKKCELYHSG